VEALKRELNKVKSDLKYERDSRKQQAEAERNEQVAKVMEKGSRNAKSASSKVLLRCDFHSKIVCINKLDRKAS